MVVHQVIEKNGYLCRKSMTRRAKALVRAEEDEVMSSHLLSLPQQGRMMSKFEGIAAALWSKCVGRFPPEPLSFVLNAVTSNQHKYLQVGKTTITITSTLPG